MSELKVEAIGVPYDVLCNSVKRALREQYPLKKSFYWSVSPLTIEVVHETQQTWADSTRVMAPTPKAIRVYLRGTRGTLGIFNIDMRPFRDYLLHPDQINKETKQNENTN